MISNRLSHPPPIHSTTFKPNPELEFLADDIVYVDTSIRCLASHHVYQARLLFSALPASSPTSSNESITSSCGLVLLLHICPIGCTRTQVASAMPKLVLFSLAFAHALFDFLPALGPCPCPFNNK